MFFIVPHLMTVFKIKNISHPYIEADSWWNELVCTGLFAVGLGIFLIILNSVISKKEEEDLETYVARQLTRSRSGNLLVAINANQPRT